MFSLDPRIQSNCIHLGDWPLSRVLLKNERNYPWFILVPRKHAVQELYELTAEEHLLLTQEINRLSLFIKNYFKPDKLNIAALGNVVPQLHIHVIARYKTDLLWPQGIWQSAMRDTPYTPEELDKVLAPLKKLIESMP